MFKFKRPIGLFLCGGGALGSWQSGALAELVRQGLHFDAVAGFSVGSLNGAAYCYNKTGELRRIWSGFKPSNILKLGPRYHHIPVELYQHDDGSPLGRAGSFMQNQLAKVTLFSNKPVYEFLNGWLARSGAQFARGIKFYVISHAVELKLPYISRFDGSAQQSGNLSFNDALMASCSIPMIFPPVPVTEHGRRYHLVDGGDHHHDRQFPPGGHGLSALGPLRPFRKQGAPDAGAAYAEDLRIQGVHPLGARSPPDKASRRPGGQAAGVRRG
ncbi:MAG: patatin-like phospholipase family protein [Elusimicrobia bacterium]|nr:patatin-like phospholipase family protein [Elusimicrobiota bacterium]